MLRHSKNSGPTDAPINLSVQHFPSSYAVTGLPYEGWHTTAQFQKRPLSRPGSSFAGEGILDVHILELAAFEHLAALQAFDKFRILLPGNDLHAGVAARLVDGTTHGRLGVALRLQ